MKKISSSVFLVSAVFIAMMFTACQKEQSTDTAAVSNAASSENIVSGVASYGAWSGSIPPSYASALAYNYAKTYDDNNQPQYVAFNAKDLAAFINNLQTKYGSKTIYVNFGVYGKGAPAVKSKDNGRLTVFFTGDKIAAPIIGGRRDGVTIDPADEFLNHGELFP